MMTTPKETWIVPLLGVLLIGLIGGCGSSEPVVGGDVERRLYVVQGQDIDEPPEIVGGYDRLDEVRTYPSAAEADDAYGVIWLQFIISASGSATQVRLVEGGHPALETEALNVVQNLDFQPATKNGAPVQARVQLPVVFEGPYRTPEEEEG
jgi:TonB family protein